MTDAEFDLEDRLRRELAELGGVPSARVRERKVATPGRPVVAMVLAVAVVLLLVTASYAVVRTSQHRGTARPTHASLPNPIATTIAPVTTVAPKPTVPPTTATTAPATTTTTQPGVPLQSVRWASVIYPIQPHCTVPGLPPIFVEHVAYPVPAPGRQLAVVLVRCSSGAGTSPSALYVFDHASSATAPHLAATLITDTDGWQAAAFTADATTVRLPAYGFSKLSLPNCCPDIRVTIVWQWSGSGYELVTAIPPHVSRPAFGGY